MDSATDRQRVGDFIREAMREWLSEREDATELESELTAFSAFVSSGRCSVPLPQPSQLRLETPDGDLVATVVSWDEDRYRSIAIDLEQDGRSGMVCEAEWVNAKELSCGIDGSPLYGSPIHTNVYDGNDDDGTYQVDYDLEGSETYYPPRVGGGVENDPLATQANQAKAIQEKGQAAESREREARR